MNRLQVRLIISHTIIVLLTLMTASLLIVLLLRNRPVAAEPIFARLSNYVQTISQRENLVNLLVAGNSDRVEQSLNALASRGNVRILTGTEAQGVRYDSAGVMVGRPTADFQTFERGPVSNQNSQLEIYQGRFEDENGEWLFIGLAVDTVRGPQELLFAAHRPQSSWREVLNIFGTAVFTALLQSGIIVLMVAIVFAWLSSRSLTRPLDNLATAASGIAEGNYAERVPQYGPDEVQDVAITFNQMAEKVQSAQLMQQDFIANVSHDLRTPLTSIQGFSQAIMDGTSDDPAYHAEIIYEEAGRLNRLVGELLDIAKFSAGKFSFRFTKVNVGALAQESVTRLTLKASEKNITLRQDILPVPDITGDSDRLTQVLTNLIDNAVKFTPPGGLVQVRVSSDQAAIVVKVIDSGQGIPQEDLPRLFERFYQVDKARGPQRGGAGLGLAIAAEIVQAHGGRISVDSDGPGKGTTFTIWFPAAGMSTLVHLR